MAKVDKRIANMVLHRKRWLEKLLKMREYHIKTESKRKWFLFVYYCTVSVNCDDRLSREFLYNVNASMREPMTDEQLEKIISDAKRQDGSNFTDKTLIRDFHITNEEILELGIGANKREQEEAKKRKAEKELLRQEIVARYKAGETITEIANTITECSKATIERIIKKEGLAKERIEKRNREIWEHHEKGMVDKEIADKCGCDIRTVRQVLKQSPSSSIILCESKTVEEAIQIPQTGCSELFRLYTTEKQVAVIDDYTKALGELKSSKENILIIGAAGTAKTSLLNEFLNSLSKEERAATTVVAPTGVASEHIGGSTIHRAFAIGIGVQTPETIIEIPKTLLTTHRIVIDEISMVRIDLFEQLIRIIHKIEETEHKKIQLIVCGDFGQIEPVVTKEDKKQLELYYPNRKGNYAFNSELWSQMNFKEIRLTYVFRQDDLEFQKNLAAIKYGCIEALDWFNTHCYGNDVENAIYICARNVDVDYYNQRVLDKKYWNYTYTNYEAIETDVSEADHLPCPRTLTLSEDIRVMLIANDVAYKNGNLGTIVKLDTDIITVKLDKGKTVKVKRKKFQLDSGGTFEQFPMVLGYAITVNKAQGCTFDAVKIYSGDGFFAVGQLYVALSRCRDPRNLCIVKKLTPKDLVYDRQALEMTVKHN